MRRLGVGLFLILGFAGIANAATRHYAAIDLGSKGTKAVLYAFKNSDQGYEAEVLFESTINTKLVSSMAGSRFSVAGIEDAAGASRQLVEDMRAESVKRKLTNVETYIVGSSAVAKAENRADLAMAVKEATGIEMDFVDAKQEGYFGLISAIPQQRRPIAILVDIGSGNTKLGCLVGDPRISNFKAVEIPLGSVSGRKAALQKNASDVEAGVRQVIDEDVRPAFVSSSMDTPCLRNRQRIYWSGGAAWATATFMRPEGAKNGFVAISRKDLDGFLAALSDGSWNQKELVYRFPEDVSAEKRKSIRVAAEKDKMKVGDTFVREDLLSGVSIMRTILDESSPSALIFFVRSGNYVYGYALEKYQETRTGSESRAH